MKKIKRFFEYFFVEPTRAIKAGKLNEGESVIYRPLYVVLLAVMLGTMMILSTDAGISGDEHLHVKHAKDILNYYKTLGEDKTAATITASNNLPYYGQLPDTVIYIITELFSIDDYMGFRHLVCSIIGWIGILFASLLAKRVGGWRAAVFTALLLFISPRYLGHSFNNLKDIPFATACIMSVYYMVKFLDNLPKIRLSTSIMLALSIAFATAIRVGGLLMMAYFGLFALVYYIYRRKELKPVFTKTLIWSLGICLVAYIIAVLVWPYALEAPVSHVADTLRNMNKFAVSLRQIFEGESIWSNALPWYYTPKYILMTIPLLVILGFVLSVVFLRHNRKQWFHYAVLFFACIFPVFWIVINNSNVYGGWRHSLFVYPPMVVLAGLGLSTLLSLIKNKYVKYVTGLAFLVLAFHPVRHCIANHPYEYVYFNQLVGSTESAYGQYEMDYYFHSLREASEWVLHNAKRDGNTTSDKIIVASWHMPPVEYYFRKDTNRFKTAFTRWNEKGETDWDYAIFCNTGIESECLRNNYFPPKNTVHRIEVDGKPICVVLKREDKNDFYATNAMKANDYAKAKELYCKALKADSLNETAIINLSQIYLTEAQTDSSSMNKLDSCLTLLDRMLKYNPKNETANYFKAYALYSGKQFEQALSVCDFIISINSKYSGAYSLAANIMLNQGNLAGAEEYLTRIIHIGRADNQTVNMLVSIYMAQGLDQANAYVKLYSVLEEYYRNEGNEKMAEEYAKAIEQIMQSMYVK